MARVHLKLLGGFEAHSDMGQPIEVPGRKAQALLAFLALPPGVAHPRDKLAALLWPEIGAAQARANLRLNLFTLRRALAFADPLRLDGDTVALDPEAVDVDAVTLERAVVAESPDAIAAALAGYRGDLLAGLRTQEASFEEWLLAERERLREHAMDGWMRLLAHQQAAGDAGAAAQTALRLLAMDPLQEPVHRALMRLYAGLGRRGDALRHYHVCVSALKGELGVDPEVETRELYQEILRSRHAPAAVETVDAGDFGGGRWRPVDDVPLVGRARELAALDDALGVAWSGRPRGVALIGDAGIGKSRLVGELASRAVARGGRVAAGQGYETEQVLPFRPWIEALRSGPIARDKRLLSELTPRHRAALSHLLPEIDEPSSRDRRLDFLRIFEAITSLVRASAARQPLLVVLEDLHWADEMTLRLVPYLCRQLREEALLVAVTLRDAPDAPPGLLHTLDELRRDWPMTVVPVQSLSRADITRLAGHLAPRGATRPDLDQHIWDASRGNPFIVVETLRALADAPESSAPLPVAAGVRELIARRLDRLGDAGRRVVTAAAVIGKEFDFALVPRVAGLDEEQAAEGVEELVRHRLLREVGGRFELVHDRIRQIVYDDIVSPRRALVHRRVAEAVEAVHAGNLDPHVTALATHYQAAGAWREAAVYLERSGLISAAHSAHRDAAASFEQALAALARLPDAEDALTRTSDLQFRLGYSLAVTGRFEEAFARYEASARIARTIGAGKQQWFAETGCASALGSLGRYAEGVELAAPALASAEAAGDIRGQFWIGIQLARLHYALGDCRRALRYARSAGDCLRPEFSVEGVGPDFPPPLAWRSWAVLSQATLGEFAAAEPEAEALLLSLEDPSSSIQARLVAGGALGAFWFLRGDVARAFALLESAAALRRETGIITMVAHVTPSLAFAYLLLGRAPDAVRLLEELIGPGAPPGTLYTLEHLQCRLGEAYLAVGRAAEADRVLREALGRARESRARGVEAEILRALGDLAAAGPESDLDAASAHYSLSLAIADPLGLRPLAARCRLDLARVSRSRGNVEDAAGLLEQSIAEFRDMGMAFWLRRAEADRARPR